VQNYQHRELRCYLFFLLFVVAVGGVQPHFLQRLTLAECFSRTVAVANALVKFT
jgi:hypothetical protein